jgi:hypothetical protein
MLDRAATTTGGDATTGDDGAALVDDGDPGQAANIARTSAARPAAAQRLSEA